jgi:hypothetical protein
LLGLGDLLCNRGRGFERAQSPYIDQEGCCAWRALLEATNESEGSGGSRLVGMFFSVVYEVTTL